MVRITNVIDAPLIEGGRDLLGIDKYLEALNRFITSANMPTTIAIQGEWGSGKTSMMNQLKFSLCESPAKPEGAFYPVWVNTWQYSLMKTTDETLIAIIHGLTKSILTIIKEKHSDRAEQLARRVGSALQVLAKAAARTAISTTGLDGNAVVDALSGNSSEGRTILELRNALASAVKECLELDAKTGKLKKGFLFFVDDLDRIDPPVAVQILELIKNIFEVENCIFILAIDYDVIVKGLEPKFGRLTNENEREFRSFFDKIIQLPFSMPLSSYSVDEFIVASLLEVNYLSEEQASDRPYLETITDMALVSVGTNPRSIKRLTNTISLIQIINEIEEGDFGESKVEKLVNFGLVCLQIAYPKIYELVTEEPNFTSWDTTVAQRLRVPEIPEEENEILEQSTEFDEDWEKIVYRVASTSPYLRSKAYNVSKLLNLIRESVPADVHFGLAIENALKLSKVTSISVDQKNSGEAPRKRDTSKFSFGGKELPKSRTVLAVVTKYVEENPACTIAELTYAFPANTQGRIGVVSPLGEALDIVKDTGYKRHFVKDSEVISLTDGKVAVCNQWGIENFGNFLEVAKGLGININSGK